MLKRIELLLDKAHKPVICFDRNRYFIDALLLHANTNFCIKPLSAQFFSLLRSSSIRGSHNLWAKWSRFKQGDSLPVTSDYIAQFHFVFDGATVKVAIDTSDGRKLHNQTILNWSDIYFKCNYWPDIDYPKVVVPLVNGNGTLTTAKVDKLKSFRNHEKKFDLVYWSRIWASPGESKGNLGVEHNIRLFESLAKSDGKKNLLAIFPDNLNTPELQNYKIRLDAVNVSWQNGWGDIDSKSLWDSLASAHINFLRPGNHLCISWRMMDLLCMGACILLDGDPYPQWPIPLKSNINYVDVGCTLSQDYHLPDELSYKGVSEKVNALVANRKKINAISENNMEYFDRHASMLSLSNYIVNCVREWVPETQNFLDPSRSH